MVYCPAGFTPFSILFGDAVNEHFEEANEFLIKGVVSPFLFTTSRAEDVLVSWIFDFVKGNLFATDGSETPLRIDADIFRYQRFYVDLSLGWMRGKETELKVSEEISRQWNFCEPIPLKVIEKFNHLTDEFYSDIDEREIEAADFELKKIIGKLVEARGQTVPPLFLRSEYGVISLELYHAIVSKNLSSERKIIGKESHEIASLIANLDGYYLCVPDNFIEREWAGYWKGICKRKILERDLLLDTEIAKPGRPRKRDRAAQEFSRLYPQGLQNSTWKQVINRIHETAGIEVSVDTLKRGLGKK